MSINVDNGPDKNEEYTDDNLRQHEESDAAKYTKQSDDDEHYDFKNEYRR